MPYAGPSSLHEHAAEHLQFIRDTMARASGFTGVPGWGGVLMGISAIATAAVAGPLDDTTRWLGSWMAEAVLAVAIGLVAMARKARRVGTPANGAAARRFACAFVPAVAAGALLTVVFVERGMTDLLPGCWLLLYGAAVTSGGALSVKLVPAMGLSLMALGAVAFGAPASWANMLMAAGFGVIQIGFGIRIARKYGG